MNVVDLFPEARVDPGADVDRRYTTRETMDLCMRLAGVDAWDLDAAADEESHWAPCWYSAQQDGLTLRWIQRTWVNPPYSAIEPWVAKAWREICHCRVIAMLLPANRTEQPWFQKLVEPFRDDRFARPIFSEPPEYEAELRQFIQKNSRPGDSGCWLWTRHTMHGGHGRARWESKMQLAHRLAYRAWIQDPRDFLVCHRCDVASCVNPSHLFLGTHRDNMRDRNAKGRTARGERAWRSLPKSLVDRIRELSSLGVSQSEIARSVGVVSSTVSRILNGKRWSTAPSTDKSPGIHLKTHYLPGRIRFGHPGNRDAVGVGSPPFGCVLLVWRSFS